ncbi:hypothetical protein B0H15DRAFT_930247 [Mycena belliarum]|uniref:Uncharacterized protein n=1 Tax=Mycena belliarum TaxID=1033014 RepID=A0AAD6U6H6_9AGAR|nr:hypothetical protein B0H15DRAFT_930247 [Mycena belliae]
MPRASDVFDVYSPTRPRGAPGAPCKSSPAAIRITCGVPAAPPRAPPPSESPYPALLPTPYAVPILPLPLTPPAAAPAGAAARSTGCGAVVHSGARPGSTHWTASAGRGAAARTVVPLPPAYLSAAQNESLGGVPRTDECGCVTLGVGCAVCGNALGTHTTPCARHRVAYTFLASAVSPPLPRRRKIPIAFEREVGAASGARSGDAFDLGAWLSQSYERRHTRAPSPSRSELEGYAAEMDAEAAAAARARVAAVARFDVQERERERERERGAWDD